MQVNVGKLCNLTCAHCHVNAGPKRKEIMTRDTADRILGWLEHTDIPVVDLTGGAPEMIPDFRYFVERLTSMTPRRHVMDRCNLTILLEPAFDGMAEFLAEHRVEIVASMPCYSPANVDAQRGDGVFDASIRALQLLNRLGYGRDPNSLPLNLVYNPLGGSLPGPQAELEEDYKRELLAHFGIVFNALYTITNVPVSRFASYLRNNNQLRGLHGFVDGIVQPGGGPRADVPGHDQRELDGRGVRLRFQPDAQDAVARRRRRGPALASRSGTSTRQRWRTGKSSPATIVSPAPPEPGAVAAGRWCKY